MTDTSLQTIADLLSKKDHTTIIHGVEKIADKYEKDEDLRNKIDIIKKKLSPS
jgi:chromosomal replication initiator protein